MELVRVYAPPGVYGPETKMNKANCGRKAHYKEVSVSSEVRIKSNVMIKIHLPTSFQPIEFIGPGTKEFLVTEECFHIGFSAKSIGPGQILRFEVK